MAKDSLTDQLRQRIVSLEEELVSLRSIVARLDPKAIADLAPKRVSEYHISLIDRIVAMGMIGRTPVQIRAAIGIPEGLWNEWKESRPEFDAAVDYARDAGKAYWIEAISRAVELKDWKYPLEKALKMIDTLFEDTTRQSIGDAALLVKIAG